MGQLDGRMSSWMDLMGLDCLPRRKDWLTGRQRWLSRRMRWLPNTGAMLSLLYVMLFNCVTKASAQTSMPGWSMNVSRVVKATPQSDATLPCTVIHPVTDYNGSITVIWRRDCLTLFFKCTTPSGSATCPDAEKEKGKFRLIGTPGEGDLTLRIKNVSIEDSMSYVCRIELDNKEHAFENRPGTILLVSDEDPDVPEVPDVTPVACPSQNLSIGLGILCGLLFIALLLLLAYVVWNKRGKKTRKPATNTKLPSGPPSIPLETPNAVPIYENIPRGGKPRATKPSE